MHSNATPTTQNRVLLAFASMVLAALTAIGLGAQSANGGDREPNVRAWVLSGFLTLVQPAVRASVPQDADLR